MQSLMSTEIRREKYETTKPAEKKVDSKIDTRFYDELFKRLQDKDSEEFKDPEVVENLYENIIDQITESPDELAKCLNSFHMDYFIFRSDVKNFLRILKLLIVDNEKLEEYISDRRISRSYEACLTCMGDKFGKTKASLEHVAIAKECLKELGNFLVKNFESIIDSENGIFTLRCFLRIIGSVDPLEPVPNQQNKNKKNKWQRTEFNIRDVEAKLLPEEWKIKKFLKKFSLSDMNLLEKGLLPAVSPCISLLMRKLYTSYPVASAELVKSLHATFVKKASSFHSMIQDSIGSRFIESYLYTCPIELLRNYYLEEHLIPNITLYCKHTYANYVVQSLLKYRLETESELAVLYDAIVEKLSDIMDLHTDLIYKHYLVIELINSCTKQPSIELKNLVKLLMKFFGCESDENKENFLRILLCYEKLEDILKESTVDQALFVFDLKPIATTIITKLIASNCKTTIKCFNNLTANEIEHLCTNSVGSHLIQECLRLFSAKERTENLALIYEKLKGRYLILATNRSGSFVMETLWSVANLKQRVSMADELKTSEVQLKNDQYAKFLMNNIGISFYKRKPIEWKQMQTNEFKKRKMLAELIDDAEENDKKKIKKYK